MSTDQHTDAESIAEGLEHAAQTYWPVLLLEGIALILFGILALFIPPMGSRERDGRSFSRYADVLRSSRNCFVAPGLLLGGNGGIALIVVAGLERRRADSNKMRTLLRHSGVAGLDNQADSSKS